MHLGFTDDAAMKQQNVKTGHARVRLVSFKSGLIRYFI